MKLYITFFLTLFTLAAFSQNDKMFKHKGGAEDVKILKVGEYFITFTYPNETAEQTIGKYAVAKIMYASGRTETVSEKIAVTSKDDWEKVVLVEDKTALVGLKNMGEIRGKTNGMFSFHTAGSADKKSLKKLKEAAAEMGASFILLTSDKDNMFTAQSIKKGFAYGY